MTIKQKIDRRVCPLFFDATTEGREPQSVRQLVFDTCGREPFRKLNSAWHSTLPKIGASCGRVYYSAEFDGLFYAVAMWSNPVARHLPQTEWLELRRLAIADDAPKFTATRFLGWMVRDIRKRFPLVNRLISYQDVESHTGTIYRAAGWLKAENYKPVIRPRTSIGWNTRKRAGRTNQRLAPRMRWEKVL